MANLFDPKNPNTWPQNYKRRSTEAFTNKGVPARNLAQSQVNNRFSGLTPQSRDPYYESGKALFNMGVVEPIKSVGRTFSGKNASVYANPFNRAGFAERGLAFGEDVLNIASLYPAARAGSRAIGQSSALATMKAATRAPEANLENYIFHGGLEPERLVGGVIDPDYVRGGDKFIRGDINSPSVKTGPNQYERDYILHNTESAEAALAGNFKGSQRWHDGKYRTYENPGDIGVQTQEQLDVYNAAVKQRAQEYLDRHSEIIRRIKAGEEHSTGVDRLIPEASYDKQGGTHLLNVPEFLRTTDTPAPGEEIKFWGKQKPVGYVPSPPPGDEMSGVVQSYQMMLDHADSAIMSKQKLATAIAKLRGDKVTPAYKKLAEELTRDRLRGESPPFYEVLNSGKFAPNYDLPSVNNFNLEEIVVNIKKSKTKEELLAAINQMVPSEHIDYVLNYGNWRPGSVEALKNDLMRRLGDLDSSYGRLKK